MGKSGRNGPANKPQSFARSNQIRPELPNSFPFNNAPPSNTLYPDQAPTPRNNSGPVRDDNFIGDNRPPWQMNRSDFGYNQNPRAETPPWNRSSGSDSRSKDPQGWNNSRQSTPYNQRNDPINSIGWTKPDEIPPQWKKQDSVRMDMRGDGPFEPRHDKSTAGERGGWNLPKGTSESPIRPLGLLESGQMERFRGAPSSSWSNQRDGFDMSHKPDWNDKPLRHPDLRERALEEEWYGSFRGPSPGAMNDARSREEIWRSRFDRPENYEWYLQRRQPESLMKNYQERDSDNRDWNNKPRNYNDPEWMNRPRHDQNPVWSNPPREWVEPSLRNMFNESGDIPMPDKLSFSRNSGPIGGPFSERDYERKRGRSPDNRDVWSRLEPQGMSTDKHINKKLRVNEQLDSGISEEVLAMIERERMELIHKKPIPLIPLIEQQSRSPHNDLRMKLCKRDVLSPDNESKLFQVHIVPQSKKSKFQMKDKDQIHDKLVGDLYKMAKSKDIEDLPQLRFNNCGMVRRTRIVINCHDAATTKWLLNWDHGVTRMPLRKILPDDRNQLAIIGFDVKGPCDIPPGSMKYLLKAQNPNLDVSGWMDGEIRTSKKGKMYVYKVDGHTLRYLVYNKWELYFDLQKLFVRRIKTNFDYNPQALACL